MMDIREKLRAHISNLFANTAQTRAIIELKEELLANSIERFSDLTLQGTAPEDAFQIVISSIGDIEELVQNTGGNATAASGASLQQRKKHAAIKAACIGAYMLAGFTLIVGAVLSDFFDEIIFFACLGGAFVIAIIPTIVLIYRAYAYPEYKKSEDTIVEDFKEYNSETRRNKAISGAIQSTMWLLIVVTYFAINFFTGAWGFSWIIFIIGSALSGIIDNIFKIKGMK